MPTLAPTNISVPRTTIGRMTVGEQALRDLDRQLARRVGREVLAQDRELVAAEPGDGVAGTDHAFERAGDRDEELVARVVAEAVVDVLEAVEVEERDADGRLRALAARDRLAEPVDEQQAVRAGR